MTMGVGLLALLCCAPTTAFGAQDPGIKAQIKELEELVQQQKDRLKGLEAVQQEEKAADSEVDVDEARKLATMHTLSIYPDPRTGYLQSSDGTGANLSLYGALDHIWLIVCAAMVMLMQAGFACVEAGVTRFKHVQNILLKNQIDVCISALGWYFFGYSFAYGESPPPQVEIVRVNRFAGMNFLTDHDGSGQVEPSREFADWFFQWAFCATAATIVSGGVAERVNFPGYALFSLLMTSLIYPCIVAWTWGTGWLSDSVLDDVNYYDFAGSGIVHMTGGVAALVAAAIVGPRANRWLDLDASQRFKGQLPPVEPTITVETDLPLTDFEPHSIPLQVLGTFILWFGWYGFNCGSTLGVGGIFPAYQAALVAINTTLSAAAAGIIAFALQFALTKKYNISSTCNGILAGLVSITAGCANVEPGSAVAIGALGGVIVWGVSGLVKVAKIDDPIDAFAVHGACGIWGVLAAAFFDMGKGFDAVHIGNSFTCVEASDGSCLNGWGQLITAQIVGIVAISAFSAIATGIIFLIIRVIPHGLYKEELQNGGADPVKHSPGKAYAMNILFDGTYGTEADTNRPPVTPKTTNKSTKGSEDNYYAHEGAI